MAVTPHFASSVDLCVVFGLELLEKKKKKDSLTKTFQLLPLILQHHLLMIHLKFWGFSVLEK